MKIFSPLTEEAEVEFRAWAHKFYPPLTDINGVWHPVMQDECVRINEKYIEDTKEEEQS